MQASYNTSEVSESQTKVSRILKESRARNNVSKTSKHTKEKIKDNYNRKSDTPAQPACRHCIHLNKHMHYYTGVSLWQSGKDQHLALMVASISLHSHACNALGLRSKGNT